MIDELTRLRRANAALKGALKREIRAVEDGADTELVLSHYNMTKSLAQADAIMHQPETSPNQPDVGFFAEQFGPPKDSDK